MIIFLPLLISLVWCADPTVGKNTKLLNIYDQYTTDKEILVRLFEPEAKLLQKLISQEAAAIQSNPEPLFHVFKDSFPGLNDETAIQKVLSALSLFELFSSPLLTTIMNVFNGTTLSVEEIGFSMSYLDQMIEAMIKNYPFLTSRQFRSDWNGKPSYFEIMNLFRMPERQTNPRAWIRIMFAIIDSQPQIENFQVVAQIEKKTTVIEGNEFMKSKAMFFEDVLIRLLRLQYLMCLILQNFPFQLPSQNLHLDTVAYLASTGILAMVKYDCLVARTQIDAKTFLKAAVSKPCLNAALNFFAILEMGDYYNLDTVTVEIIRSQASMLITVFPDALQRIEKICGVELARQALLKKEAEAAAAAGKVKASISKKPLKSVEIDLGVESDEEFDDEPTVSTPTVTVTPNEWRPTEVWMLDARVHLAQYCRVHFLYPALSLRYPDGVIPDGFKWIHLANGDPDLDFCIAVTTKRNEVVKNDQIFKFLPDLETAYLLLSSHFNVDKQALNFVMKFAPGPRLVENPTITSTLISEGDARYHVTILALYPVCQRVTSLDLKIEEVNILCAEVKARRNAIAHPTINESFFNSLKKEMLSYT